MEQELALLRNLAPGRRVLDIGCGPGTIDLEIAPRVCPGGYVIGLDRDVGTLMHAADACVTRGCTNVQFLQGSAYELPFDEAYFHVVYCRHLLMHLTSADRALQEAVRVTRKGGCVVAREGDLETWSHYPKFAGWERLFGFVRQSLGNPAVGRQLWAMFHQSGLVDVQLRGIAAVATGDDFRNHMFSWLQALEAMGGPLTRNNPSIRNELDRALAEGRELMHQPYGLFSCLEYEISGRKAN